MVELEAFRDHGGGIEPLGDNLLLVTPRGRIALIHADGEVNYFPQRVPMNESDSADPTFWVGFRVADILLHERLSDRFTLFVSHHYLAGECVEFRISSTLLSLDQGQVTVSGDWKTEFTANPCIQKTIFGPSQGEPPRIGGGIQAGGRMLMDGAEHLLVAIGDHGWYEWHERQESVDQERAPVVDPDSHLGRLVRIDLTEGKAEIVTSGLRNPQGLARDAEGNLWQTEHGPQGGDELNLARPGLNYGWPYVTYGINYGNRIWPYSKVQGRHDGFEEPVFAWIPSIAISNLIVSDSRQFPLWKNDLLIASLKDLSLFRVRLRQERVTYIERIMIGERIRDITQLPDGRIALLADYAKILFLQRAPIYCQDENDAESIYSYDADDVCTDVSRVIRDADDPLIRSLSDASIDNPVIRSLFNVYIVEDQLVYLKSPCSESDLSHTFLLHITPVHANDLAEGHRQYGINVHDFYSYGESTGAAINEAVCIVVRALPDYEIERIFTGQVIRVVDAAGEVSWKGPVWSGDYSFSDPTSAATLEGENAPLTQADSRQSESRPTEEGNSLLIAKDVSRIMEKSEDPNIRSLLDEDFGAPIVRSHFNVYAHDNWLIYVTGLWRNQARVKGQSSCSACQLAGGNREGQSSLLEWV